MKCRNSILKLAFDPCRQVNTGSLYLNNSDTETPVFKVYLIMVCVPDKSSLFDGSQFLGKIADESLEQGGILKEKYFLKAQKLTKISI